MKNFNLEINGKVYGRIMNKNYNIVYQNIMLNPPLVITNQANMLVIHSEDMRKLCDEYMIKMSKMDYNLILSSIKDDETNEADKKIAELLKEEGNTVPLIFVKLLCKYMVVNGVKSYENNNDKEKENNENINNYNKVEENNKNDYNEIEKENKSMPKDNSNIDEEETEEIAVVEVAKGVYQDDEGNYYDSEGEELDKEDALALIKEEE